MTACASTRARSGAIQFASAPRADCCQPWARDLVRRHLGAIEARVGTLARDRWSGGIGPPLGRGAFGCVLPLADPALCLKVTSDEEEGPIALYVRKLQDEGVVFDGIPVVEGTARVLDVFRFPGREDRYGIVRERVGCVKHPGNDLLMLFADAYSDAWDMAYAAEKPKDRAAYRQAAKDALASMESHPRGRALATVLRGFWSRRCPLMDAHRGNLCWRVRPYGKDTKTGDLVLMDFGASDPGFALARVGSLNRWETAQGAIESERRSLLRELRRSIPDLR